MPAGVTLKMKRKAGAFAAGELSAGEWGLDVSAVAWYFSANGTSVVQLPVGGATLLSALTDVAITAAADNNVLTYDSATSKWTNQTAAQAGLIAAAEKAAVNGIATLGADGKIPAAQIPAYAISNVFVVASQTAQLAAGAQIGDFVIRTDIGETYVHNGGTAGTMADFTEFQTREAHTHDAADIISGNIATARIQVNVAAALQASAAATVSNSALVIDGGSL